MRPWQTEMCGSSHDRDCYSLAHVSWKQTLKLPQRGFAEVGHLLCWGQWCVMGGGIPLLTPGLWRVMLPSGGQCLQV